MRLIYIQLGFLGLKYIRCKESINLMVPSLSVHVAAARVKATVRCPTGWLV